MRRGIFIFALILLGGASLAWLMQQESGYLLIVVGQTTIEMNLWAALAALLLFWGIMRLLLRLLRSFKVFGRWRLARYSKRRAQTARGLVHFIEGRWDKARRELVRGAAKSDMPLVNYLAAANAAFEEGDTEAVQGLLAKAEQASTGGEFAMGITQARLHLKASRFEEALAILNRIHRNAPQHPYVMRLLEQAYRGLNDWDHLQKLLPDLRRHKVYDKERFATLEVEVYSELLASLAQRAARNGGEQAREKLLALWEGLPAHVKRSPSAVASYSDYLQRLGEGSQAETLLRKTLNTHWDDELVRRYGFVTDGDTGKQLVVGEAWLRERPNNPVLLLTLGRLAQRAELWGKARDYLESSLKLSGNPETYAELARLMSQMGDTDKSAEYYQRGLLQSAQTSGVIRLPQESKA